MDIFVTALTIFILAIFVGFEVITKVPPTLHTPRAGGADAQSALGQDTGLRGSYFRHHQRGRRFSGDRPHAEDVQEEIGAGRHAKSEYHQHSLCRSGGVVHL